MDYQSRMRMLTGLTNEFLRNFQRPHHLTDDLALAEIRNIAEEVNALCAASLSPDAFRKRVEDAFRELRRGYTQRQWPTVAHFVRAVEQTAVKWAKVTDQDGEGGSVYLPSEFQIAARRIKAGEAVGDTWVFGRGAVDLLNAGLVAEGDLRPYRSTLYFSAKAAGGRDYAEAIEAKIIARHEWAVADFREGAADGR